MRPAAALLIVGLAAAGCTSPDGHSAPTAATSPAQSPAQADSQTGERPRLRLVGPGDLRPGIAPAAVEHLAGRIGPRPATGPAYRRGARWVAAALRTHGYEIRRQAVDVPGGRSWGVPVAAGRSLNVVATAPGFDGRRPHLVVGAHLDTVPQAPGAEDNGSGIGVLLAVAEAVAERRTRLPLVLVAFGAEEPRGPTDDDHHYGSRAYVAALSGEERRAVRGMLSLDRVGVGAAVPVCLADAADRGLRARVLAAARRARVPAVACENRSSDHWSFVRAGLPGIRVGGTSYAGYHSERDVPAVVSRAQLVRSGRVVLAWLAGSGTG